MSVSKSTIRFCFPIPEKYAFAFEERLLPSRTNIFSIWNPTFFANAWIASLSSPSESGVCLLNIGTITREYNKRTNSITTIIIAHHTIQKYGHNHLYTTKSRPKSIPQKTILKTKFFTVSMKKRRLVIWLKPNFCSIRNVKKYENGISNNIFTQKIHPKKSNPITNSLLKELLSILSQHPNHHTKSTESNTSVSKVFLWIPNQVFTFSYFFCAAYFSASYIFATFLGNGFV